MAGWRVSAAATAIPTTSAPAMPTERRIMNSNRTRPSRPREHRQAGEEDGPPGGRDRDANGGLHRLASARVPGGVRRASSSRNRLSTRSE